MIQDFQIFTLDFKYHSRIHKMESYILSFKCNLTPSNSKCIYNNNDDKLELRNMINSHIHWSSKDILISDNYYKSWLLSYQKNH